MEELILKRLTKLVCLTLAFVLCMAIPVSAQEIAPYSSSFFGSYNTYLWKTSNSSFQVWYDVTAVAVMAEIGVDYIDIERSSDGNNWSVVKTYDHDDYSGLVRGNAANHYGYVTYSNMQSGYQYRAYVRFYAKNSSGGMGYYGAYAYF